MYSYIVGKNESNSGPSLHESKKCKGFKKCVVKKTLNFDDYKKCLFSGDQTLRPQLLFRSCKHEVKTLEVNKLALSREDDKRITIDGIASYARGHNRISYNSSTSWTGSKV